jgi:D-proline reductase (dithiol) PrdB
VTTPPPIAYMARTRAYYEAQGFQRAYAYAHHDGAPFTPLPKPLARCTLGLVTTASVYPRAPLEPRRVESTPMDPPPQRLYTDDLSWDKDATHTDDVASFCPIAALQALVREGVLGALAPRFHCAPTEYSQRATVEHDAPEILRRLREDGADIALLVPL